MPDGFILIVVLIDLAAGDGWKRQGSFTGDSEGLEVAARVAYEMAGRVQ
jgi:hypothetical protein